ncbi:MAG: histidine phosphatase family protein [Myxococcota bacterium]
MERTRLVLVRHGQTEFNMMGKVQGHSDSPLTDLGRTQAHRAGRVLAERGITRFLSSDLGRAMQTSAIIESYLGFPAQPDPRLREVCFGTLEGRTWEELDAYFEASNRAGLGTWFTHVPPGGESRAQMQDRAVRSLTSLCVAHPGETILVVSHGGFIGFFFRHVLSMTTEVRAIGFRTQNCAIHEFEWKAEQFHLLTWGESRHLVHLTE